MVILSPRRFIVVTVVTILIPWLMWGLAIHIERLRFGQKRMVAAAVLRGAIRPIGPNGPVCGSRTRGNALRLGTVGLRPLGLEIH